jgi:lysine biosynthesis protein LysW
MDERPLCACPECAGEIDLTFADLEQELTCTGCGAELVVVSLDPPEVEAA